MESYSQTKTLRDSLFQPEPRLSAVCFYVVLWLLGKNALKDASQNYYLMKQRSRAERVDIEKRSLKKLFPNLTRELEGGESKVNIDSVRADPCEPEEEASVDKFRHYSPTVIDFLRRCDTEAQAESVIAFMEKRGELTKEYAEQLRKQLRKEGVRSFGSKKEDDYYFKQGGLY